MTLSYAKVYFTAAEVLELAEQCDSYGDFIYRFNEEAELRSRQHQGIAPYKDESESDMVTRRLMYAHNTTVPL